MYRTVTLISDVVSLFVAMDVLRLQCYRLAAATITVREVEKRKPFEAGKARHMITNAAVRLTFRSLVSEGADAILEDVMLPAGSGAFKDVFVLEHNLWVVKLMMKSRNISSWMAGGAAEEQKRFECARERLQERMAFCYGHVYLAGQAGDVPQSGNYFFCEQDHRLAPEAAIASITVQEKLIAAGHERIQLLLSKQPCNAATWREVS